MAAQGCKRPRVTEPVTAIVEGESVGDELLYDGRSYRIAEEPGAAWGRGVA